MPPGLTPQQLQSWYATLYQGDELGQSLSSSLASQLGNTWTSGVVSPWQRAIMAYGGNLDPYYLKQLDQFTAPKWYNPFTKEELPVGMSLADALDPSKTGDLNVLAEAAKNPFSKLNQINRQLGLANAGANLNWAQHGAMNSGSVGRMLAESGIAAQEQRATAAQAVLDQISGTYSGFLNSLITAGQTQGQYVTDAMGRIRDLVTNQIIVPPTNQTQITPRDYDQPGVFPVGTPGFGPYRDKPLY